jgi:hypothetical protein
MEGIRAFHAILRKPYNIKATVRENHGSDIDGACGQLALKNKAANTANQKDIEDLGSGSCSSTMSSSPKKVAKNSTRSGTIHAFISDFVFCHQQSIGIAMLGCSLALVTFGLARRKY